MEKIQNLADLYQDLEQIAKEISYEDLKLHDQQWNPTHPDGHYCRILAAYAKYANINHCLELGTANGHSAFAIAKFAKKVTTCDTYNDRLAKNIIDKQITVDKEDRVPDFSPLNTNIQFIHFLRPYCAEIVDFSRYDMVFVDIDPHEGVQEINIHNRLIETYNGIVFYDDIDYMKEFWQNVENDKLITDCHGRKGSFGIVRYENSPRCR